MQATAFSVDVRPGDGSAALVLHGDVNADADPALPDAYAQAIASGASTVDLDFGDVGYMNSTGIALVVGLLAEALRDGRTLRATGLSDHYREIFAITRLSDHIVVLDGDRPAATGGAE